MRISILFLALAVLILTVPGGYMAHTAPDWGAQAPKATTYALSDMAELAARLGSIHTHDRRGDVVWMDDFEGPVIKWAAGTFGTGGAVAVSADRARNGTYSAKVTTDTELLFSEAISHQQPYPTLGRFGFEFSFSLGATPSSVYLLVSVYNGAQQQLYVVTYDAVNHILKITTTAGATVTIDSSINLAVEATLFHTLKLVLDGATGRYHRLLINERSYDLSSRLPQLSASTTTPRLSVTLQYFAVGPASDSAYFDDFIITQNEP